MTHMYQNINFHVIQFHSRSANCENRENYVVDGYNFIEIKSDDVLQIYSSGMI